MDTFNIPNSLMGLCSVVFHRSHFIDEEPNVRRGQVTQLCSWVTQLVNGKAGF